MASTVQTLEWKTLAEQASVEMDGDKLQAIVNQLCAALDAESQRRRPSIDPAGNNANHSGEMPFSL